MKFELNEYHRNITDKDLIDDVKETACRLKKRTLYSDEYTKEGKYNHSTLIKRFGSWEKVLKLSGLETKGHNFKCDFTDEEVIKELHEIAQKLNKKTVTAKEYTENGKHHSTTIISRYGNWNNVLKLAGLELTLNRNFSSEEMLEEIERIWILLGRQPTSTDIKNGISKFSLQSYSRRFGGWRGALQAFVAYINQDDNQIDNIDVDSPKDDLTNEKSFESQKHKTRRDINLRLRFKVMSRDNFKCCICGASPAKDPSIELHIDHIIAWSKGGETTIDNLQTLCSKCNYGKSDL